MPIKTDKNIDRIALRRLQQRLGKRLKAPITVFLGNPAEADTLWANEEKTRVWIVDDLDSPNLATSIYKSNIPKAKLIFGTPIRVVEGDNGFEYHSLDPEYDAQFSEEDSQQPNQQPVLVSQIGFGTIQPYSGMNVSVKGAFYGDVWVKDTILGNIDDQVDTSAAPINIPTTNNKAKGILVQVDVSDPLAPVFSYKQSSQYNAFISLEQAYSSELLPYVDEDEPNIYRVGYIQLYTGQVVVSYADILQAPEWIRKGIGTLGLDADIGTAQTLVNGDTLDLRGDGTVTETELIGAGVIETRLIPSGVTPATYINPDLTIDQFGRVTSASSDTTNATLTTNNATPTVMMSSVVIAQLEGRFIEVEVKGFKSDYTAGVGGKSFGVFRRASGGNVTLVDSLEEVVKSSSTATFTLSANTSSQLVELIVTGVAAETWNWTARMRVL